MQTRNPASVLPDPVGAAISVSRPAAMWAHPASWGGVGPSGKRRANHSATAGWNPVAGSPTGPGGPSNNVRSVEDSHHLREYRPGGTVTPRRRGFRRATRVESHVGPRHGHWARPVSRGRPPGGGPYRLLGVAGLAVPARAARPRRRLRRRSGGRRRCWPASTWRWAPASGGSCPGRAATSTGPAPPSRPTSTPSRRSADGYEGPVKVRIVGPWSLVASIELPKGEKALADEGAVRDVAASLAEGLRRPPGRPAPAAAPGSPASSSRSTSPSWPPFMAGEMPTASGWGRLRIYERAVVEDGLRQVLGAASGAGRTGPVSGGARRTARR